MRFLKDSALILLIAASIFHPSIARAQTGTVFPYEAEAAYEAYNANFLVQSGGLTYYNGELNSVGSNNPAGWCEGLDIAVTEDYYDRTQDPAAKQLIVNLLDSYGKLDTTIWSGDGWNDDIGWMVNGYLRGYQITGDKRYLSIAEANYNNAFSKGWDDTLGGGIYENMSSKHDKCCLSNDPFIWEGVMLYKDTGDAAYLADAKKDYNWVRTHLFNPTNSDNAVGSPGRLRQGEREDGTLEDGDNFYNSGSFLEAANALHEATGDAQYYNDAVLTIGHVMSAGPVLHNGSRAGNQWGYWVFKGLSDFCTDNNCWKTYFPWMLGNADAAWNERNSDNLTWNDWTSPTDDPHADALEMTSAVAIWQLIKFPQPCQIINKNSNLVMGLPKDGKDKNALIGQWTANAGVDSGEQWMVVPLSSGNSAIISASTGMAASIFAASTSNGAQLNQWPFSISDMSQQFTLVPQGKGWYEIKNANSGLALDDSGGSSSNGAPIVQLPADGRASQMWKIRPDNTRT